MPTVSDDLRLASDFAPATADEWRKLVDGVLKGAPFQKLVSKTYDGIAIQPIYTQARDASPIVGRAPAAPWQIMQRIDYPDAAKANTQALTDLANGATGLTLVFAQANSAHGFGLPATAEAIATVLKDVHLDADIAIELNVGPESRMAATFLVDHIKASGIDPAKCNIRWGFDPIGATAVWGQSALNWWEMALSSPTASRSSPRMVSKVPSPSPTAASSTTPAALKFRNSPMCYRSASLTCAR